MLPEGLNAWRVAPVTRARETGSPEGGSGLIWWLLVVDNGDGREGPWGLDGNGQERLGPGPSNSSGLCSVTTRVLTNTCGE